MSESPSARLEHALATFQDALASHESTPNEYKEPIQSIWQAAGAVEGGADAALRAMVPLLATPHDGDAAFVALCCGGLVEQGADPMIGLVPLMERLPPVLDACVTFVNTCLQLASRDGQTFEDFDSLIEHYIAPIAEEDSALVMTWQMLELFVRASLAFLGQSPDGLRAVQASDQITDPIQRLAPASQAAGWLNDLLGMLNGEEFLVIHREQQRGYRIRISGINSNFDLHMLLADMLIGDPAQGWLAGERPDAHTVAVVRGTAEAREDETARGTFNMAGWRDLGIDPDTVDAMEGMKHWIWNEGAPIDIEPFEGTRVILLDVPFYNRSWQVPGREYPKIAVETEVLAQIEPGDVRALLERMAAACDSPA